MESIFEKKKELILRRTDRWLPEVGSREWGVGAIFKGGQNVQTDKPWGWYV